MRRRAGSGALPAVHVETKRVSAHMVPMTTRIRTLRGFHESKVSLAGADPVRAYVKAGESWDGAAMPVLPQYDLVHLVAQLPGIALVFSKDSATVIASDGSPQPRFPVVFVAGIGLRCFDARFAGWAFQEVESSLADALLSA
jgi:hypothetical protein